MLYLSHCPYPPFKNNCKFSFRERFTCIDPVNPDEELNGDIIPTSSFQLVYLFCE